MKISDYIQYDPLSIPKSLRYDRVTNLTSGKGGQVIPVAYAPVLREDRVRTGRYQVHIQMNETVKTLLNAVKVRAYAHFYPFSADTRFDGMDHFNRSYAGQPESNDEVTPFFEYYDDASGTDNDAIFEALGIHSFAGAKKNKAIWRAYNGIWNYRAAARSKHIAERPNLNYRSELAPAFWNNPLNAMIVPDYEQAMMDGEVPLTFTNPKVPVQGIANTTAAKYAFGSETWSGSGVPDTATGRSDGNSVVALNDALVPQIFAEMQESGATVSLANIEAAKKTAAFAKLRERFKGVDDDYLIDLLMEGIRLPDEAMRQPILLDRKESIIGYTKRYATDGGSLGDSVTVGETKLDLRFRTPALNTGGIIMVTVEIVPDQIFERMSDDFAMGMTLDELPQFVRDDLDPEKVELVRNKFIDVKHSDPSGVFGYAPLNYRWKRQRHNIGGKFIRTNDAFNEDRQRIWSITETDPSLTENFYVCNNFHHDVFADTEADPFEIVTLGELAIEGHTVFGKGLSEDEGNYDAVAAQIDTTPATETE